MSDARWEDIAKDLEDATRFFGVAVRLSQKPAPANPDDQIDRDLAFQHAMQSGHTSAESALKRMLDILGEERPTGDGWHRDLIERLARELHGDHARPAAFPEDVRTDLHETRNFRHRAMHGYDSFDWSKIGIAIDAARRLQTSLPAAVIQFRRTIDPDEPAFK